MLIRKLIERMKVKLIHKIGISIQKNDLVISRRMLPEFATKPRNLTIELPRRIFNPERMYIGDNVSIGPGSLLNALLHYPTKELRHPKFQQQLQHFDSRIIIGNNVTATAGLQISAQKTVTIEDDVMFASNIHINDGFHGFETAKIPYKYQKICKIEPIVIKSGCWIGQNAVILPGVTIGENSIIGSNSVVNRNIPPKSIAVGIPARVIKIWDENTNKWLSSAN